MLANNATCHINAISSDYSYVIFDQNLKDCKTHPVHPLLLFSSPLHIPSPAYSTCMNKLCFDSETVQ